MTAASPQQVLRRFRWQVWQAARQVARDFEPRVEFADAHQEASVLVLAYAGLMPGTVHYRSLQRAERDAKGDEKRVRKIIGTKLRLDLSQLFGRQVARDFPATSLEALPPGQEPYYEPENRWIARIDARRYVRRAYPYLSMVAYDEMSEGQIVAKTGCPLRTIERSLAAERSRAKGDPFFITGNAA